MDIKEIINQYFENPSNVSLEEIKGGAINLTYHVIIDEDGIKKEYVLQKMKSIFDTSIMDDIEFITEYLSSKNFLIQEVVYTQNGEKFVKDGNSWWRLMTYISGNTFHSMLSSEHAFEAGRMVGEFHSMLADYNYEFKFKLPHYHDTDFIMEKLQNILEDKKGTEKYLKLKDTAESILTEYKKLAKNISLPKRIIHGDLKLSNILFDEDGKKTLTLIDLDTLMNGNIAIELGDALRSWCMPRGEDAEVVKFDLDVYNTVLDGYFSTAKFLTTTEKDSISYGVKLIALELAARFTIDAFEENYFVLDSSKYKNLFNQNKKRAENQLEFFKEYSKIRE